MNTNKFEFKFDKDQEFQLTAIRSVLKVFEGLPENEFKLTGEEIVSNFSEEFNLSENFLRDNVQEVQRENEIDRIDQIDELFVHEGDTFGSAGNFNVRFPSFTIEMETGTGKTYVYLRTIFELYIKYGFKKFIIVVPSVAIYKGVVKSYEVMIDHFMAIYGNQAFALFEYESSRISILRHFAADANPTILLMTMDSFNRESNNIYKITEKLNRKPVEYIQKTRPIIILDEPQRMAGDATQRGIRSLNPLFTLRYSATHRETPNLLYRLTPVDAFRLGLVKRIQVIGIEEKELAEETYLKVIDIDKNKLQARIKTNVLEKGQLVSKELLIKRNDDLYILTKNEYLKNYIVNEINIDFVDFGMTVISKGEYVGTGNDDMLKIQIRETIKQHMKTQKKMKGEGIKVLSLFFIDRVANYIDDNGKIKVLFDEEFNRVKIDYPDFNHFTPEQVRGAYFAKKKNKNNVEEDVDFKDPNGENLSQEEKKLQKKAFELIMQSKEKLLSFDEKMCFIFAHSALREGWDNPNVFQICTLNQTHSNNKKRQEIGRGLRLCVNLSGDRVKDENFNILTVIANESYKNYVDNLQRNYEEDGDVAPQKPAEAKKAISRINDNLIKLDAFKEFWKKLGTKTSYDIKINQNELIRRCIDSINNLEIPEQKIIVSRGPYLIINFKMTLMKIQTDTAYINVKIIRTDNEMINKDFFVTKDEEIKIDNNFYTQLFLKNYKVLKVDPKNMKVIFVNGQELSISKPIEESNNKNNEVMIEEIEAEEKKYPLINILKRTENETGLTRKTINLIFKGLSVKLKEKFIQNPETFIGKFIEKIKFILADHIAANIKYYLDHDQHLNFDEIFPHEINISQKNSTQGNDKSLYDKIELDSDIEKNFLDQRLKKDENIISYFKFPSKFKIKIPKIIGNYNPDWGIIRYDQKFKIMLELIRETKGTDNIAQLRFSNEGRKIVCGMKHFKAVNIDYDVVTDKTDDWFKYAKERHHPDNWIDILENRNE